MKQHYIYLTTDHIHNKKYIGKHFGELNDDYYGSGNIIKRIIDMNDNQIFVEGDNKEFSCDSRNFGWIDKELIVGVVHYI